MLTRCPRCNTSFRVLAEHLKLAHGRVQCGRCYIQFDALETLYDEEPDEVPRLDAEPQPAAGFGADDVADAVTEPVEGVRESRPPDGIGDVSGAPETPETPETPEPEPTGSPDSSDSSDWMEPLAPSEPVDAAAEEFSVRLDTEEVDETESEAAQRREIPIGDLDAFDAVGEDAETDTSGRREPGGRREIEIDDDVLLQDFSEPLVAREHVDDELIAAQARPVEDRRTHPLWGVVAALLLMLGAGQFVWYQRDNLVRRFPPLRPAVEAVCARLGCTLKPQRDLDAIKVLARDVRDHPRFRNSLLVNATIENEASFTQPYPTLELTLYDADGKMIGVRRFQPQEYLDSSIPVAQGMKPQQPVYIVLEIARPAEEAVSFEFKFF
jgi:predicted Zn finger-like uncharacterized protein